MITGQVPNVGGHLELRMDGAVPRHYLLGRPLVNGTRLEMLLTRGQWLGGIYEWSGVEVRWPVLRFEIGGSWESNGARKLTAATPIPPDATLRFVP